jgi:hypothetical protein
MSIVKAPAPSTADAHASERRRTGSADGGEVGLSDSGTGGAPPTAGRRFVNMGERARGGMGSIHEVFDASLRRSFALKVLKSVESVESVESLKAQFVEEACITAQLEHPNVVPVYDIDLESDAPSFSMKLVEGRNLAAVADEAHEGALTPETLDDLLGVFLRVCEAVAFAHSRGVVHRDLKPENVMVGEFGQVYLMDWGIARVLPVPAGGADVRRVSLGEEAAARVEEDGILLGTPAYMAPEQAWGQISATDERTDVYGLGGVLHYLLTGAPPNPAVSYGRPRSPSLLPSGPWRELPPRLCEIAVKALATRQEDRYQTVLELHRHVQEFVRGGGWFSSSEFKDGEVIVAEGERGDSAFVITAGECDVFREIGGGRVLIRTLGVGDVFGELAIFTSGRRTATIVARGAVSLRVVTRAALERELDRNRWLSAIVLAISERFVATEAELDQLRGRTP